MVSERLENLKSMSTSSKKPSWIPPIVALVSIILSLAIFFINSLRFSPAIYFAYILTPFIPILALALARTSDTKARSDIFYDLAKGKQVVTTSVILSIASFLVALPVMYQIANELSQI